MSSTEYINYAVRNVQEQVNNKGKSLPYKSVTPMSQVYHPELDATNEPGQEKSQHSKNS